MIFNMVGSSGMKLNFEVAAYATEEELIAATPKDNTVGVVTDSEITSWVFSPVEPTEPTEGMVWFELSTKGDVSFEALRKNSIVLYPTACKHYINGEYIVKCAYLRSIEDWAQFAYQYFYLYNHGDTCDDVTGGWTTAALKDGYMYIWSDSDGEQTSMTSNVIPTSKYNELHIEYQIMSVAGSGNGNFGYGLFNTAYETVLWKEIATSGKPDTEKKTITIDISSYTEDYYVKLGGWFHGTYIYRVWLV